MQRNASTEKFQAVVGKVKLANRVVRRLQFHTTRTVARAIDGPDSAPKRVGFNFNISKYALVIICSDYFPEISSFLSHALSSFSVCSSLHLENFILKFNST